MANEIRLKDLALALGVSITTVSKALNGHPDISEKTRNQIVAYANEVNYIPNQVAKNFRQQRTNIIGVILNDNSNPYNARMMHGIENYLNARGYLPVFMDNHDDGKKEQELIRALKSLNAAGILLTPASKDSQGVKLLRDFGIPYVLTRQYLSEDEDAYVVVDDERAGYIATKYLLSYRNPKVFFLNASETISSAQNRRRGYLRALEDDGMQPDSSWIISDCRNQLDGYNAMRKILETEKPPFSVVCFSDYIAAGAICALQERRIQIPHEVAVMGADNIEILSFVKPRLSTLDLPKKRLGMKAAEILIDIIEQNHAGAEETADAQASHRYVFKPELLARESG